jgi:polygalacturonase
MLFNPNQVTGIVINNVAFKDSPMFNIGLSGVKNVHIYNISITAPASGDPVNPSHNTDGIDAGNSQNVLVENSYISVGK